MGKFNTTISVLLLILPLLLTVIPIFGSSSLPLASAQNIASHRPPSPVTVSRIGNISSFENSRLEELPTLLPVGSLASAPAVSTWGPDHLNVFALGSDNAIWNIPFFNGAWHSWNHVGNAGDPGHPPGVNLTSAPAAVSWDINRIDIFARDSSNDVWHISYDRNTDKWSGWDSLGMPNPGSFPDKGVSPVTSLSLGFESGDITHGWEWGSAQYQTGQPDRLVTIDKNMIQPISPDPTGTKVLKVTVQPNDIVSNGARAEVVLTNPLPTKNTYDFLPGEEVWYHWYTMFPNDLKIPNSWHIWTQVHQEADFSSCPNPSNGGRPMPCPVLPLGFNLQNYPASHPGPHGSIGETLEFSVINKTDVNTGDNPHGKGDGDDILWTAHLNRAHWYDILLHVKWAKCGSYSTRGVCTNQNGGFVEMWVDHTHVVPKTSHFTMDDDGKAYLKQGLYHCRIDSPNTNCAHINFAQTIYHDGMKVAECVTPAQPNRPPYFHPDTGNCYTLPPYS